MGSGCNANIVWFIRKIRSKLEHDTNSSRAAKKELYTQFSTIFSLYMSWKCSILNHGMKPVMSGSGVLKDFGGLRMSLVDDVKTVTTVTTKQLCYLMVDDNRVAMFPSGSAMTDCGGGPLREVLLLSFLKKRNRLSKIIYGEFVKHDEEKKE